MEYKVQNIYGVTRVRRYIRTPASEAILGHQLLKIYEDTSFLRYMRTPASEDI